MVIIQNTMEDVKRYIVRNDQTDDARKKEALRALSLFACPQVAENSAMQAVVSVFQHRIFAIKIFQGNIDKGNIHDIIKTDSTKTECREVREQTNGIGQGCSTMPLKNDIVLFCLNGVKTGAKGNRTGKDEKGENGYEKDKNIDGNVGGDAGGGVHLRRVCERNAVLVGRFVRRGGNR